MQHKVSELCDRVNIIYEKSMNLRRMKYDTPKEQRDEAQIQFLIDDIQHLCRMIGADTSKYQK
jgi:cytochrome c